LAGGRAYYIALAPRWQAAPHQASVFMAFDKIGANYCFLRRIMVIYLGEIFQNGKPAAT
jgi:hypothetical protein